MHKHMPAASLALCPHYIVWKSKGGEIVRARDYWIFLVAQHEMSRLEMDELGLLGI